jgi:Cu/Ag efflux protein CusF
MRPLAAASLALAALAAAGCGGGETLSPPDATYTVRGQVLDVPHQAGGDLTVHHEAVPDFRDRQGKPSVMDSMSMPFTVAKDVSLAGIAPGDKVELTFEVRWEGDPTLRAVEVVELPEGTRLDLGGPTLERVAPLGPAPGAAPASSPPAAASRPATDGPSSLPSGTI